MSEHIKSDNFRLFQRQIYLVALPILILSLTSYWLFSPYTDDFTVIASPIFSAFLILFWIVVYRDVYVQMFEYIALVLFTIFHCSRFYISIIGLEQDMFKLYLLWCPLFYICVFIMLPRTQALLYSLFIYGFTLIMGLPHFTHTAREMDTLPQLYISNLVFLLIFYFFRKLIAVYIKTEMESKLAFQDSLTSVPNRRMIDIWLEEHLRHSEEQETVFSVVYFDIDHFKQINDTYGHDAGDSVLQEFASLVRSLIEPTVLFGRWGGEEFILLSTGKNINEAEQYAEWVRQVIEDHAFSTVGRVTASFGISTYKKNDTYKTILKRADEALYIAKNSGRNRVKALNDKYEHHLIV
ncbi:GGDEF domain-containing protein [Peribacillus sp. SCS-155]|uniref:GGDEF domain-containing protein n=1 Tax=Peribacillus sedimenti TaxID=3115297 RepID=UPI00390644DB